MTPKATRGPGIHLVPSQQTERIQADYELKPFTEPSLVYRLTEWWSRVSGDKMFWLTLIALIYLSIMLAWAIVTI